MLKLLNDASLGSLRAQDSRALLEDYLPGPIFLTWRKRAKIRMTSMLVSSIGWEAEQWNPFLLLPYYHHLRLGNKSGKVREGEISWSRVNNKTG